MRTRKDARRFPAGFVDDPLNINARNPTSFVSIREAVEDDESPTGSESNGAEVPETTPDTRRKGIPRTKNQKVVAKDKSGTKKRKNGVEKDDMQRFKIKQLGMESDCN
ncbi:hypothetical protein E3N88_42599 [Mikania micrantha]|uniref:Uncharacterized protein n=1 Tax=Mikania micrantha TaxID=192012 RepID=A0A5N6LI64_9ASTR|nr:hypothetical protein E3N88_42599 [Mikania micrantha]